MKPWPDWRLVRLKRWLETFWVLSKKLGHFESSWRGMPYVDGEPAPWINYSAIEFLELCAPRQGYVLEYGCGNSSLWWLDRGLTVHSVERKEEWAKKVMVMSDYSARLEIRTQSDLAKYPGEHRMFFGTRDNYEAIFIDGEIEGNTRLKCLQEAKKILGPRGMIIIDNVDWLSKTWQEATSDVSYLSIPISGFTPGLPYTTVCLFMFWNPSVLQERLSSNLFACPFPRGAIEQDLEV